MTDQLDQLIRTVRSLAAHEQLTLLQVVSAELQDTMALETAATAFWNPVMLDTLPAPILVTDATDLPALVADWWPADETADAIHQFVAAQRHTARVQPG